MADPLHKIARRVSELLLSDLKSKKISVIGIDVVRQYLREENERLDCWDKKLLETKTLRCVIEGVG